MLKYYFLSSKVCLILWSFKKYKLKIKSRNSKNQTGPLWTVHKPDVLNDRDHIERQEGLKMDCVELNKAVFGG